MKINHEQLLDALDKVKRLNLWKEISGGKMDGKNKGFF